MQNVNTSGTQGICPTGWHIPTQSEFNTLVTTIGNDVWAYFAVGQGSRTNSRGFSALLAGYYGNRHFGLKDSRTNYWISQ